MLQDPPSSDYRRGNVTGAPCFDEIDKEVKLYIVYAKSSGMLFMPSLMKIRQVILQVITVRNTWTDEPTNVHNTVRVFSL
jgi:hypothetical protein